MILSAFLYNKVTNERGDILKIAFYTLGCKVNQNETGALEQLFCDNGFSLAQPTEDADVYIVNSCTVTAGGDKKSRQWLRRAKRQNPDAVTVLTGCYPQAFPQEASQATEGHHYWQQKPCTLAGQCSLFSANARAHRGHRAASAAGFV